MSYQSHVCGNFVKIAAGDFFSLAIFKDGRVTGWGRNDGGQINIPIGIGTGAAAIAGGDSNSIALLKNGTVTGWGNNNYNVNNIPVGIGNNAIAVSAGDSFSIVLLKDGRVTGWGNNLDGQTTIPVGIGNNATGIAAGNQYVLALLKDGRVTGWGSNDFGQITIPVGIGTNAAGVAAGYDHSLALLKDGTVTGWGSNNGGQALEGNNLTGVIQIAAGYRFSLALLKDGKVTGWGRSDYGQTTIPVGIGTGAAQISAGLVHSIALLKDGRVTGWGYNEFGQTNIFNPKCIQSITFPEISDKSFADPVFLLSGFSDSNLPLSYSSSNPLIASISGATEVKINNVGSVTITASQNGDSNFEPAIPVSRSFNVVCDYVKKIAAGYAYSLALFKNERITGWGLNNSGQALGGNSLTGVVGVTAGQYHSLALLKDGRVTGWGDNKFNKALGGNSLTGVVDISLGYDHSLALLKDGRVTGWGDNSRGQALGGNSLTGVVSVSAGNFHGLVLLDNGRVTGWGDNSFGQALGGNSLTGVVGISAGGIHGLALLDNGRVTGWGYNGYGQVLGGNSLTGVVGIDGGENHNLALLKDGRVTGWGNNAFGQSTTPVGIGNNATSIVAGHYHSLALLKNGIVTGWGHNTQGQLNVPKVANCTFGKPYQNITFPEISDKNYGTSPFYLSGFSDSNLPLTYSSSNSSIASIISGSGIQVNNVGNVTITASQTGNSNFEPAIPVSRSFSVNKLNQTITFSSIPTKTYGDSSFSLTATASSSLPVTYTSSNTNVATINGSTVTVVGVGSVVITASQAGNSNYNSAVSVSQNLTINKKNQFIELNIPSFKSLGDLPFNLQANSNSNLPIYFSSNNPILTIQGNLATINDIGIVAITAYQEDDQNWIAAETTASIVIKKTSKLEFPKIEYKKLEDPSFNLNVTTDNNEVNIQYQSSDSSIAQVSSIGDVTILKAGTVTITAKQNETTSFFQNSISRELFIDKSLLTIEPIEQSRFYTNYSAQKYSNRIDNEIYNLYLPKAYESHTLLLDLNLYGFDEDDMADCDIEMNAFILKTGLFGEVVKNPTILNVEIKNLLPPTGILFDINDILKERNILKNIQVNNTLHYNTSYYKNNTIYSDKRFNFIKNEIFISKPAASRGKNIPYPLLFEYKNPVSNLAYNIGEYSLAIFDENDNKIKDGNFITGTETGFFTFLNPGKYNLILSGNEKDFLINETNRNKKNENLHAVSLNIKSLTEQKIREIYKQNYDEVWASYYLDYRDLPSGSYALNNQAPIAFNIDFERNTSGSIESPSLSFKEYTGYYENNCSSSTRIIISDPICTKSLRFICRLGASYELSGFRQMDIPRNNFPKSKYNVIGPSPINTSTDITKQLETDTLERTLLTYLEDPADPNYYTIAIDDNLKDTCCYCKGEDDWEDPTAYIQGQIYSGISVSDSGDAIYNNVYFMDDISPKGLDLKYNNSYYSGQITYKAFEEGDKVLFNQYQFDFNAVFKGVYDVDDIPFEKQAVAKEFIFSENLTGQNYFSGKNDLINKINNELAFKKYYTWIPFKNNPNIEFNYGPLLSGQNGGLNSNNEEIINLVALNSGKFGAFNIKLELTPRNKVYSYMVPKIIKLQISEDGENWIDVVSSEDRQPINTYLNSPNDTVFPPIEDTNIKYENLQDETITITQKITISSETSSQNKNTSDIEDLSGLATGLWSVSPYNTGNKNYLGNSSNNNSLICIPSITGSGILCGKGYTDFIIGNVSEKGGFKCTVSEEEPEDCGIWKPSGDYLSLKCDPELINKPKYLGYSGNCCSGIYDPIKRPTGWCCSGIYQNGVNEIGCKPCEDITDAPVDENKKEETIEVKKDVNVFRLGFYDYNS
jgi:hypothetical protein